MLRTNQPLNSDEPRKKFLSSFSSPLLFSPHTRLISPLQYDAFLNILREYGNHRLAEFSKDESILYCEEITDRLRIVDFSWRKKWKEN